MEPLWQGPNPPPLPSVPPPLPEPRPWNGWWTLLWAVIVLSIWLGVQMVIAVGYMAISGVFRGVDPNNAESMAKLQTVMIEFLLDGDLIGILSIAATVLTCPVCYYLGGLRKGFTGAGYLGLGTPRWGSTAIWMGGFVGLLVISMSVLPASQEDAPSFMLESVRSATIPLLLIVGVVVGAPLLEEFVFRGLLFRGWRSSILGVHGTVAVTSLLWTALHAGQYGIGILGWLFALGLILGYARHQSGSVWVPIAMHALNNALATIETYRLLD